MQSDQPKVFTIDDVSSYLIQHLLSLRCHVRTPTGELGSAIFSGFLIEFADQWLFVTAGHVLDFVAENRQNGYIVDRWELQDTLTYNRPPNNMPIPFDYDNAEKLHWYVETIGIDYAIIGLRPMYCDLLQKGNIKPITEHLWGMKPLVDAQVYLAGIPAETIEDVPGHKLRADWLFLPLKIVDAPDGQENKIPRLFGRLNLREEDAHEKPASVKGMSGGPWFVFGRNEDSEMTYKLVAIQSGVIGCDLVTGCLMTPFMEFLKLMVAGNA